MKLTSSHQAEHLSDVIDPRNLDSNQRLERWAQALERRGKERLNTLHGTEFVPVDRRFGMRAAHSPLSVAYDDPVLRSAGLKDDTYGEAVRFFGLSDWQLHTILCHCHHGESLTADQAAVTVRSMKNDPDLRASIVRRACTAGAALAGGAVVLALLA